MMTMLAAGAAVILIYLLRPPAQKILVPSSLLWEQLVKETANRRRLLRWLLSLLLSALIVLLLVSMIFKLEPRTGSVLDPVLLLDNTGSMGTLLEIGGDQRRLDNAKRRALEVLARSSGTVTVADLAGTVGPVRFENAAEARRVVTGIDFIPGAEPRIPEQLLTSMSTAPEGIFLFTDNPSLFPQLQAVVGAETSSDQEFERGTAPTLELVDVYREAPNVGIIRFEPNQAIAGTIDRQPDSAYLEILNGGDASITARLRLDVFDVSTLLSANLTTDSAGLNSVKALLERDLTIEADDSWSGSLDLTGAHLRYPLAPIAVRASVNRTDGSARIGDAQPMDDEAWIVLQPRRTRLVAADGVNALPRWLTRIIATSPELELVRARASESSPEVTLYPSGFATRRGDGDTSSTARMTAPCMILPPRLAPASEGVKRFQATAAFANVPTATTFQDSTQVLQLPWTEFTAIDGAPAASEPWAWATIDDDNQEVVLVARPDANPCSQWFFDPVASNLHTRAEFPALIEALLAATVTHEQQSRLSQSWGDRPRELVRGTWKELDDEATSTLGSGLTMIGGTLSAPPRPGRTLTAVATAQSKNDGVSMPARAGSLGDAQGSGLTAAGSPLLGWPGRAVLAALVIGFLLFEAVTRFTGVTE